MREMTVLKLTFVCEGSDLTGYELEKLLRAAGYETQVLNDVGINGGWCGFFVKKKAESCEK